MNRQHILAATATPAMPDGFTQPNGLPAVPIVLGLVGHRDLRPGDRDVLKQRLNEIFRQFRDAYPHTPLVLLSALAEGADQLAAEAALGDESGTLGDEERDRDESGSGTGPLLRDESGTGPLLRDESGTEGRKGTKAGQVRYWGDESGTGPLLAIWASGKVAWGTKAGQVRYWQYGQAEKSPDLAIGPVPLLSLSSRFSLLRPAFSPVPLSLAFSPDPSRFLPSRFLSQPRHGGCRLLSAQPLSTGGCGRVCSGFWVLDP